MSRQSQPSGHGRSGLDVPAIVLAWLAFALWVGRGHGVTAYDAFRDMAYAHGILRGHLGQDPSLPGYAAWYPPGNALFFAALAALTRLPVATLFTTSLYWLGWSLPVTIYLLVRPAWGRGTALLALPLVFLGSFWWLTHAAMPMASVQGVPLGLLALLAWRRAAPGGALAWLVTGAVLALAIWHHPLCGIVALGAIGVHGLLSPLLARDAADPAGPRFGTLARAAGAALVALTLASPLLLRQLITVRGVRLAGGNTAAYDWFAPELHDPGFALHAHAPFVLPLGLLGLWLAARRWRDGGWLVGYFVAGFAGEVLGYLGHDMGWPVPWVLPHEFQWHEQLALSLAAAIAIAWLAELVALRVRRDGRTLARGAALAGLLVLAVGPVLPRAGIADLYPMRLDERWSSLLAMARWVGAHTPLGSVLVCTPDAGYDLSGLAGSACVALPPGHMNPAADLRGRNADLGSMLTTRNEQVFLPLARKHRADYLLALPAPGTSAAVREVYAAWTCLEAANLADSAMLLYRIRREAAR